MALRKGLPAKLALTDADDTRYDLAGLIVCNADGSPRGGVLSPVGTNLVTATSSMNVSVARFQGAAVRDGGVVLLANDGATNVLLDAAPAANSRIDVIYAKQNDASSTVTVPDANNLPVLGFVKGTAGAVPVKPSIPVGALELATVTIPSTATATNSAGVVITQTAAFTATAGGNVPFRTRAELAAWTTATRGQHADVFADSDVLNIGLYRWSGTAWKLLQGDTEWINATVTGGNTVDITPKYRRLNGFTVLEGRATMNAGSLFVLPAGLRPNSDLRLTVAAGATGTAAGVLLVSSSTGAVTTAAGATVNLAGAPFPADL